MCTKPLFVVFLRFGIDFSCDFGKSIILIPIKYLILSQRIQNGLLSFSNLGHFLDTVIQQIFVYNSMATDVIRCVIIITRIDSFRRPGLANRFGPGSAWYRAGAGLLDVRAGNASECFEGVSVAVQDGF